MYHLIVFSLTLVSGSIFYVVLFILYVVLVAYPQLHLVTEVDIKINEYEFLN